MKEKPTYKNELINESEIKQEKEIDLNVPVIDIIRHGETEYKELTNPNFKFKPEDPDFKLDQKHLDLSLEGIENILKTAKNIESRIDKENEIVLFVTSPNYRAESSALLIKDYLEKAGILTVDKYLKSKNIEQIRFQPTEKGGKVGIDEWIEADKKFRKEEAQGKNIPPEKAHRRIAERIGKEWEEIFSEDYEKIDKRFERFLRHMINIKMYFSEKTKTELKNKKIRIIILTHEEIPSRYIQKIFGENVGLQKAQNLELQPNKQMLKGKEINIKNILYSKNEGKSTKEAFIKKSYF